MITETEIPAELTPLLFDGQLFYGKWGEIFFVSKNRLCYTDMASTFAISAINDNVYGRYFLQDIEPVWQRDSILRELYRYAKPWVSDLSGIDNQQLITELLQLFQQDELRVWQLTDGWASPPEPIGGNTYTPAGSTAMPGNSAAAANSASPSGSGSKASKPKGGATTTTQPVAAKTAGHEANSTPTAKAAPSKKVIPESLEHAQQILAERRKQIEQSGYQPKYSDAELLAMAEAGEVANESFHVRFMAASNLKYNSLGAAMEGNTGKGAKYWSTTFDQMEAADSDPELICKMIGIEYDPNTEYALAIIDTEKAYQIADTKCVVASFEGLNQFCKEELSSKFTDEEIDLLLSDENQQYYAKKYEEACNSPFMESPADIDGAYDYFTEQNMPEDELALLKKRTDMHKTLGNNQHYLGNGLTKNLLGGKQQYGVVETVNFERRMISIDKYGDAIVVNPKLTPIKG
ncbi:hypothetical protein [Arsukibacterium indicum]|uniref:Uncharacterized protein n=1 Tax=Arsukibacterium indicum TaxID=2848612 RepID=A0ABS6MQ91_9GAMM|nr:hypothetical protein [Arsukibacterium indicum]MBV2130511.1 hypothetical protein [Arsukibacterium indicum]